MEITRGLRAVAPAIRLVASSLGIYLSNGRLASVLSFGRHTLASSPATGSRAD